MMNGSARGLLAGAMGSAMVFGVAGCRPAGVTGGDRVSLTEAREGFETKLRERRSIGIPAPEPPGDLFELVQYPSEVGDLVAYVSKAPAPGRYPAMIWLVGGFGSGVSEVAWEPADEDNDQSARAFREAGMVLMLPSYRGGNTNPGHQEGFFGEVDDVIAAAEYLAQRPEVDPDRIYLGGHSTGGTLALLVAASTDRFRGVFAFGPVASASDYGQDYMPFDIENEEETQLRAPIGFLSAITSPTFVFEGMEQPTNVDALLEMEAAPHGLVKFYPVPGKTHFSVLAPMTSMIAEKILTEKDGITGFALTEIDG
jgi:dienelactone hydrolase